MAQAFSIAVGDTGPDIVESLFEVLADGTTQAVDLTGASNVTFHLLNDQGVSVVSAAAAVLVANPAKVSYSWQAGNTAIGGSFLRRWTAVDAGGAHLSWPNDTDGYPVVITDPAVTPATGRLTCTAWCTTADVVRCGPCGGTAFDTDVLEESVQVASDILFLLSGKQFSGVCPDTVRPIRDNSLGWWFPTIGSVSVTTGESFGSGPYGYRARDFVRDRRHNASEILLPAFPVRSITQVRIDGQVLAPSEYRVADDRWLLKVHGAWPVSQDVTLAATEIGTFEVVYTSGVPIPPMGVRAAAAYACEVAQACTANGGAQCALPPRTQTIVRQGLTVNAMSPDDFLDNGRTGLADVDRFLKAVNPDGIRDGAAVFSPDVDWPATRIRSG